MSNKIFAQKLYNTITAVGGVSHGLFLKRNSIYFKNDGESKLLFKYVSSTNGDACFGLDIEKSKNNFCSVLHRPDFANLTDDERFVLKNTWFIDGFRKLKSQLGPFILSEMSKSVMIDFYIRMNDDSSYILMCFSKHSDVSGKNVHYQVKFDLNFNFIEILFMSSTYKDRYQLDDLAKFSVDNKIKAFYVLFNYYTDVEVKTALDETMADEFTPFTTYLTDDNLNICYDFVGMLRSF